MDGASYKRPPSSSWSPASEKRFAREPLPYAFDLQCRVVTQPHYRRPNISLSAPRTSDLGAISLTFPKLIALSGNYFRRSPKWPNCGLATGPASGGGLIGPAPPSTRCLTATEWPWRDDTSAAQREDYAI